MTKSFQTGLDQRQLVRPLQALDLHLAFRRRRSIGARLGKHKLHRHAHPCVFGGRAGVMRREAFFQIVGDAAVQGVVGAAQQVAEPVHHPSP